MKSLYITSIERYSGKTATCLALGKRFQADGYRVGYLKPLSLQPWRIGENLGDEDAAFVKETLNLPEPTWELSTVILTNEFLRAHLRGNTADDLMEKVKQAFNSTSKERDILLLEGGGSLREGHVLGLPTPAVALALSSNVLVIVNYHTEVSILDDSLSARARLGDSLSGVILNRIPKEAEGFVNDLAIPHLKNRGVPVIGALPHVARLAALTVGELIEALGASVLSEKANPDTLVETLTVGAMTAEAALHRFRKQMNKAVITGGDRTDIQLAALETSTACLILTGNLHPSPLIVKQADAFGVSVLLVPTNTMETIETIERIFGKTRLGQPSKLAHFEELLANYLDFSQLYRALELDHERK